MKEYEIDGWIRLSYPEHFEYNEEEDHVSFYSVEADAQGTLQMSIYEAEEELSLIHISEPTRRS